jgi:2,4-dienoyl-CoA reductase-like NADH-dependent reductase (Old Yellow Enzyme family)
MAELFTPIQLRELRLRNRLTMSPMCTYSAEGCDGVAGDWHLVHYGARAAGGVGLVIVEATAVEARGRITPHDLGIWSDDHVAPLRRITDFLRHQGAASALQLAHAGRKAATHRPWAPERGAIADAAGGWPVVGPSDTPFSAASRTPRALTTDELAGIVAAFAAAAQRAHAAGFDAVELHAAHGYLLHSFLSPLSNERSDGYGGSREGRARLLFEVIEAVRAVWPASKPLLLRISASDWHPHGWNPDDSVWLARAAHARGVDLVDCSSGGAIAGVAVPVADGYQVPFAERVRREAGVASGAVGRILTPEQAEAVVAEGRADLVLLGKPLLADPQWAVRAAQALGAPSPWAAPYGWVFPS